MILDAGIMSVFSRTNTAQPGDMPVYTLTWLGSGWYGLRNFSTRPTWVQDERESTTVSLKIRVHQNLAITNQTVVVLSECQEVPASATRYQVVRAWHGQDDDTGMPITDLDLEVVRP